MYEVERQIKADPSRVWAFVSDVVHWGDLLPTMQQVERLDGAGPITVGSRFRVVQPGLPKATYEITHWDPERGFTWAARSPGIHTTASHWLTKTEEGTHLLLGLHWSGPLAGVTRRLLGGKVEGKIVQEADTFVELAQG